MAKHECIKFDASYPIKAMMKDINAMTSKGWILDRVYETPMRYKISSQLGSTPGTNVGDIIFVENSTTVFFRKP